MANPTRDAAVRRHARGFFAGHACTEHAWTAGPRAAELPRLRVMEFAPGPRSELWAYVSVGGWELRDDPRLEFVAIAPDRNLRHVELLTMAAWYHGRYGLGVGHTFPIGEPWLPGSACDHFLVSLPYPFGSGLEVCNVPGGHLHVHWLLPITAAEREFKVRAGQDALEEKFEANGLAYWNPARASTV